MGSPPGELEVNPDGGARSGPSNRVHAAGRPSDLELHHDGTKVGNEKTATVEGGCKYCNDWLGRKDLNPHLTESESVFMNIESLTRVGKLLKNIYITI